ncbi:MAG: DivIVA domain-containing protein [Actinomycetota bacterium]
MAMSFSRSDPAAPAQVAEASFSTARRGFDQNEVRDFLQMVAAEMSRLTERVRFLEREVEAAQTSPDVSARLDEDTLTRLLGEETARVLSAARASSAEIREKAEQAAAQLVSEASDEAARLREEADAEASRRRTDAAADAESEVEMAKQQGREMVNEARAYRERVLSELSRRRELAREQIEQLVHGRDRLVAAFEQARVAAVDVMAELEPLGEPNEYVDLTPTTGPVPVMVARDESAALEPTASVDVIVPGESADTTDVDADAETELSDPETTEQDASDAERSATATSTDDEPTGEGATPFDQAEVGAGLDVDDAGDADHAGDADSIDAAGTGDEASADVVVDLFARLRSETDTDDEADTADDQADSTETDDTEIDHDVQAEEVVDAVDGAATETDDAQVDDDADEPAATSATLGDTADSGADLAAETDDDVTDDEHPDEVDGPFAVRDAELTPLIVAAARKLKRVLADEQNDVLDTLRTAAAVTSLDHLVPVAPEQIGRYVDAVSDDLLLGAQAGAASTDADSIVKLRRPAGRRCVDRAGDQLGERLVGPLRDRLERAVGDADGDTDSLTKKVRAVYREVKTRHIDEVLDDVFRVAHGAGRSAVLPDGSMVRWTIDTRHPACPDCDDNALSEPVPHGEPFPTGHDQTPAHPGCRCMLQLVPS